MTFEGPPWLVRDSDTGRVLILEVPEGLKNHPVLQQRGIVITEPAKPGAVYTSDNLTQPQYAVKILDLNTEERAIYERLLPLDPASPNHTLPGCEIA
ncbi:hypothetical protein BD413DRAFT_614639 [Trametes elegans]|nr:hypothetical protein BD413DRAFT_614639 [Trametes elegans]